MLDNLIPNLTTLIITVRRNMLSSVMTTVMIIAIIVAWSARGNISEWVENNPTAEEQSLRVVRGVESDRKIENALRKDLEAINADRVLIRRFSDQIDSKHSTIIPYVTTTHIVTAPGVSIPSARIVNMPRSYISDATDLIYADPKHPVCIHLFTKDIKQEFYRTAMQESGAVHQYMCPVEDLDGVPMGMVIAGYLTLSKDHPDDETIYTTLGGTGVRVAGYLHEVTAPERQVWWRQLLGI
jgi:hypothetical protein